MPAPGPHSLSSRSSWSQGSGLRRGGVSTGASMRASCRRRGSPMLRCGRLPSNAAQPTCSEQC
eukprot:5155144-Lingulodinium_polyedra.AAC.1